jgi:dTDP-D-glucose 4,6-dehydratase
MLGWKPEFTLDRGLEKTIVWYENFLDSQLQILEDRSGSLIDYAALDKLALSNLAIQQVAHN